jgi:uncharacterized protein YbcC (UPF0753/DUF2309 family)
MREVAARMAVLAGIHVFRARKDQRQAWKEGRISDTDLTLSLKKIGEKDSADLTLSQLKGGDEGFILELKRLPLCIDLLEENSNRRRAKNPGNRLSWQTAITHQVSQVCGAYFDQHQAMWQPDRKKSLYVFWREELAHDHGIGVLMGCAGLGKAIQKLPLRANEVADSVIQRLGLNESSWENYLEATLLTVKGWASWCAYLGWSPETAGIDNDTYLRELLAIRLAWDGLLLDAQEPSVANDSLDELQKVWDQSSHWIKQVEDELRIEEVWQLAAETAYQRKLFSLLSAQKNARLSPSEATTVDIKCQALFCIDVRSERFRRALESESSGIQTLGFAGFFGLPVNYTPFSTTASRPQLPGLISASMEVRDAIVMGIEGLNSEESIAETEALELSVSRCRQNRFALIHQWLSAIRLPASAFFFVESMGILYLWKLKNALIPNKKNRENDDLSGLPAKYRGTCRPRLVGLPLEGKISLAHRLLQAMGLTKDFAPIVAFIGHGSQSENNPYASALDCGACCGQTGEVNARSLAHLLNEKSVREGLKETGMTIPDSTVFIAALHNTTTDEVEWFDVDFIPKDALAGFEELKRSFNQAGNEVRKERASSLGISEEGSSLDPFRRRANDASETRPEWGLAGNAAFLIAPRKKSLGVNLEGRVFLHDYDSSQDPTGALLEFLMTGPMLVTHWINAQYHASTCDPLNLGSGNKLLHNVVGGNVGVFEGNGGDLRIGLAKQSLHDGERWIHEPLRLTVIIDAPQSSIDAVVEKHPLVKQLVENRWIHLLCFEKVSEDFF